MRRREFICLLGGAAAWPFEAHAQQAMPVIGVLASRSLDQGRQFMAAFREGLNQAGFREGQSVVIEYLSAEDRYDLMPALAAELVRRQVAVLVAVGGAPPGLAAKAATSIIPIVFIIGGDPVKLGLVESLNRPGGNVTGVTILSGTLTAKRLELLRELLPGAGAVAFLINPTSPEAETQLTDVQAAARTVGQDIVVVEAGSVHDLDAAFAALPQQRANAVLIANDAIFVNHRKKLVALAARHSVPAMYFVREFADEGGLISYGNSLTDAYRRVGIQTARILKGAKPGDLPVEQAVKVELVINLRTAKTLGLTLPISLLGRADEVIE
jgi:putative ABC transport system substrate-binding protein